MKKYSFLIIALLAVQGLMAQGSKNFDLSNFNAVSISNFADVIYTTGDYSVRATGPQELLDNLVINVKKGSLNISNRKGSKGKWNSKQPLVIRVSAPTINAVAMSGSGDFVFNEDISVEKLAVAMSGSGDIESKGNVNVSGSVAIVLSGSGDIDLSGKASKIAITASGSGDVDVQDFRSADVVVVNSGSAEVEVYASEKISVVNSGSGDVEIDGNPKKKSIINTGSGDIDYNK